MFKGTYWPEKDYSGKDEYGWAKSNTELKKDKLFHIHKKGEKTKDLLTIYCKKCGRNIFHVCFGDYWTGVKCVICGWEEIVDEE